jgi:hypothetical protein
MVSYKYTAVNGTGNAEGVYSKVFTTKATNTYRLGKIIVTKDWEDFEDKYMVRPSEIKVKLMASAPVKDSVGKINKNSDGTYTLEQKTLSEQNNWKATWSDLPVCNVDGGEITYTLNEYMVDGKEEILIHSYDATSLIVDEDGATEEGAKGEGKTTKPVTLAKKDEVNVSFINTLATTSFIVKKAWDTEDTDPTNANEEYERRVYVELESSYDGETWYPKGI